jgi:hypothetical protein
MDGGAARERAFTLPQIVELLEETAWDGSPRERVDALRPGNMLEAPEIEDPIGLREERQKAIADEVEGLATRLADALFS